MLESLKAVMQGAMAQLSVARRRHQIGPGRKSIWLPSKYYQDRSIYSPADCRALRAKRGVGRPPNR